MNKQQIIIIDGHDKAGKSTIAAALSKRLKIPVFKRTNVKKNYDFVIDLFYSIESYLQFLEQTKYSVIFDRLYPSEYAYSQVFNRMTSREKIYEIDERFSQLDAKIIILKKKKTKQLKDELIDKNLYDNLTEEFQLFTYVSYCKTLILDTSNKNLKKQLETIIKFINQ